MKGFAILLILYNNISDITKLILSLLFLNTYIIKKRNFTKIAIKIDIVFFMTKIFRRDWLDFGSFCTL